MSFLHPTPDGFQLIRADGTEHNRIRGDLIPADSPEIIEDGRHFIRTGDKNDFGFLVYREGFKSFVYDNGN